MKILKQMKWHLSLGLLISSFALTAQADDASKDVAKADTTVSKTAISQPTDLADAAKPAEIKTVGLFDAIDQDLVDAKFVARSAAKGRLVLTNKTKEPVNVLVPEAFAGVPVLRQFGGGGGGGGGNRGGGGGGGGNQSVGGGGGGGGNRGGGGGGRFNIAPEKITRIDVPLLCLDHGLRDPSSSKSYEVRPIEDVVKSPAMVAIVKAYANGELPRGAAQAATWHINNDISWNQLSSKLTGTTRQMVRHPYFSRNEIQAAMAIVSRAQSMTAGQELTPRNWKSPSQKEREASEEKPESDSEKSYEHKEGKTIDTKAAMAELKDA